MRQLPNLLTSVRIILTPFLVAAILEGNYGQALAIGIIAGLTDTIDGTVARWLNVNSRVGAYLDPIADKLFLGAAYIAEGMKGLIPWWMVILVFARDLLILAMAAYGYAFTTIRDFPPSVWGKLSTFVQIFTAMAIVWNKVIFEVNPAPFLWIMVATTLWSGVDYTTKGIKALKTAA